MTDFSRFVLTHLLSVGGRLVKVLDEKELEGVKLWMLRTLLNKRVLHKYRLLGKYFCIAVDGTGYQKFDYEPYPGCPYRRYKGDKKVWFQPILEAKLVTPNGFSISIGTEWVLNGEEYTKQDCELKAFKRLGVKGRCIDNIFIERLWWSVKYEDVYIKHYENGWALEDGLEAYFLKYNQRRRHSKIEQQYPYERYTQSIEEQTAKK